jgi:hypothetical protein
LIKRPNLHIFGVGEGTKVQTKDIENLFNGTVAENSPNLWKDMTSRYRGAFRILNRNNSKNLPSYC